MGRLIMASNRLPVTIGKKNERLHLNRSVGGLATGLSDFFRTNPCVWFGWHGYNKETIPETEKKWIVSELAANNMIPVFIPKKDFDAYYFGFSNRVIWPLFHYFQYLAEFDESDWLSYVRVNRIFAEAIASYARPDDEIWIHDYQLMLLPSMLRDLGVQSPIGFFLHIPFPSYEIFRLLPSRAELLNGLMGANLIGFHTSDYASYFLSSVSNILGLEHQLGFLFYKDRYVKVDTFPMGIEFDKYASAGDNPAVTTEMTRIRERFGGAKIILSVDRLDYTKGIVQRLQAYERFLDNHPERRGKVVLVMVVSPSRDAINSYLEIKKTVEEMSGRINGKHATIEWSPVLYLYQTMNFVQMSAWYRVADVALITPLRDGMNLVAKEYIAARSDGSGSLILSEFIGAARELGEARVVNPYNIEEVAETIHNCLECEDLADERENMIAMRKRVENFNVEDWAVNFLDKLREVAKENENVHSKDMTSAVRDDLCAHFKKSNEAIFFLDYDGTLVEFAKKPQDALPDPQLKELLAKLASVSGTRVVIISGRDKETLDAWFSDLPVNLVAEHGGIVKHPGGEWLYLTPQNTDWKSGILPVMERFNRNTPGAFVEDKELSLVWHYRSVSKELGKVRALELKRNLNQLTQNHDLRVFEGNKIIEVKTSSTTKAQGARYFLQGAEYDFVFAVGDDFTDEDLFSAMPIDAYTFKIGYDMTSALYRLKDSAAARSLLQKLTEVKSG